MSETGTLDHSDVRRRAVTLVVLIAGTGLLALSLGMEPGSTWFHPAAAALAVLWAFGALASGPIPFNGGARPGLGSWATPVATGVGLGLIFVAGALLVREIPFLADQVEAVLAHTDGDVSVVLVLITIVSGCGEEMFFRGALYAAIDGPRVTSLVRLVATTLIYALVTAVAGNVMLGFAALTVGALAGWWRQRSGGVLAPCLAHVSWSLMMLLVLPHLVG